MDGSVGASEVLKGFSGCLAAVLDEEAHGLDIVRVDRCGHRVLVVLTLRVDVPAVAQQRSIHLDGGLHELVHSSRAPETLLQEE